MHIMLGRTFVYFCFSKKGSNDVERNRYKKLTKYTYKKDVI